MTEPNWYVDPSGRFELRYHDGVQWTAHVSTGGVTSTDPLPGGQEAAVATDPTAVMGQTPGADAASSAAWGGQPGFGAQADVGAQQPAGAYQAQDGWAPAPTSSSGSSSGVIGLLVAVGVAALLVLGGAIFLLTSGDDGDEVEAGPATEADAGEDQSDEPTTTEGPTTTASTTTSEASTTETTEADTETTTVGSGDVPDPVDARVAIDEYGTDPEFDQLADDCQAGNMTSCDDLYIGSEIGSGYEAYGDSCGGRNIPAGYCVDIYNPIDDA